MSSGTFRTVSTKRLVTRLARIKLDFGADFELLKDSLLGELGTRVDYTGTELLKLHEILCFMEAHPDSRRCLDRVTHLLTAFESLLKMSMNLDGAQRTLLADTGVAGSYIEYPFSYHTAIWLNRRYGKDIEIDWDGFDNYDVLSGFLHLLASGLEVPTIDDPSVEIDRWIKWRSSREGLTDFQWLMNRLLNSGVSEVGLEGIYEVLDLTLIWELRSGGASRTRSSLGYGASFFQEVALSKGTGNIRDRISSPLPKVSSLGVSGGREVIDLAYAALSVRGREIYPLFYANPKDVHLVQMHRGVVFALVGMKERKRFGLDTDYFFLGLKNDVPICYGSGVICLNEVEVAINIFSTFRRGESAWLYVELMRLFRQVFGVDSFLIDKFQIGAEDNDDAIKSGAFWFYHKLGFKPVQAKARAFLKLELGKKKSEGRTYRTKKSVLRQFATSDLRFHLEAGKKGGGSVDLASIGFALEPHLNGEGLLNTHEGALLRLGVSKNPDWTPNQKHWIKVFSPLVVSIPDMEKWSRKEKRLFMDLILAKADGSEFEYLKLLNSHSRLKESLQELSRVGGRIKRRLSNNHN